MKNLNIEQFLIEAGTKMSLDRDMSAYNGKPFHCACGSEHGFQSNIYYQNYVTTGVNAKIITTCPLDQSFLTLIKTKYKFFFIFDKFISVAGCKVE